MRDIFALLKDVNPMDTERFAEISTKVLLDLVSDDLPTLRDLITALPHDEELAAMCESLVLLDKLVLYKKHGFRLRLHIFRHDVEDLPHNHRFPFTTLILKGGYRHNIYGKESDVLSGPSIKQPILTQKVQAGSIYTISQEAVHSAVAEPGTMSLMIRSASVLESALFTDPGTRMQRRQRASSVTDKAVREKEVMPKPCLEQLVKGLAALEIPDLTHYRALLR
ncbi:hypothetical protein G6L08_22635 [Agrobacterium rhizogenes]|nr:hypothetical protein [Rhizobium rhizogenes]